MSKAVGLPRCHGFYAGNIIHPEVSVKPVHHECLAGRKVGVRAGHTAAYYPQLTVAQILYYPRMVFGMIIPVSFQVKDFAYRIIITFIRIEHGKGAFYDGIDVIGVIGVKRALPVRIPVGRLAHYHHLLRIHRYIQKSPDL